MASQTPPQIFAPARRIAARKRMLALQTRADAPHYLLDDMAEDVAERIAFLRHAPKRALVIGDYTGILSKLLFGQGACVTPAEPAEGFADEEPFPVSGFDFVAALGTLDTVNDLPGALIHIRNALAPGGLAIMSFPGAGSLPALRAAMLSADGDRPAPRIHPQVDVRTGAQLLQRAGFADPVADSRSLDVGFRGFARLVADLRAMGLSNVLARAGPALGKGAYRHAGTAFEASGIDGRTVERFEIVTLSGWKR